MPGQDPTWGPTRSDRPALEGAQSGSVVFAPGDSASQSDGRGSGRGGDRAENARSPVCGPRAPGGSRGRSKAQRSFQRPGCERRLRAPHAWTQGHREPAVLGVGGVGPSRVRSRSLGVGQMPARESCHNLSGGKTRCPLKCRQGGGRGAEGCLAPQGL